MATIVVVSPPGAALSFPEVIAMTKARNDSIRHGSAAAFAINADLLDEDVDRAVDQHCATATATR
jgi:hypothetical protein